MKKKNENSIRWLLGLAVIVLLSGMLISATLAKNTGITQYPTMISDAYSEKQHRLTVPGTVKVNLMRPGAYGIYYESSYAASLPEDHVNASPEFQCALTSNSTGKTIQAVPDHVETNRYWNKNTDRLGVLVMSLTVDEPGIYDFHCVYADENTQPETTVALGPNYFWEFLRVSGKIALPVFGSIAVFFGATLLATLLLVIACALKGYKLLQGQVHS